MLKTKILPIFLIFLAGGILAVAGVAIAANTNGNSSQTSKTATSTSAIQVTVARFEKVLSSDSPGHLSGLSATQTSALDNIFQVFSMSIQSLTARMNAIFPWFTGGKFHVQNDICVDTTCITKDQFKALLVQAQSDSSVPQSSNQVVSPTSPDTNTDDSSDTVDTDIASSTPTPTITIVGDNPMTIVTGTTFSDPGATASETNDDEAFTIHYTVDGVEMETPMLDTSTTSAHTIIYSTYDTAGNWAYATRTIDIIEPEVQSQ